MKKVVCNRCGATYEEGRRWGALDRKVTILPEGETPTEVVIDLCQECFNNYYIENLKLNTKYATRRKRR